MKKAGSRELASAPTLEPKLSPRTNVAPPPTASQSLNGYSRPRFVKGATLEKPPNNDEAGVMAIILHPLNLLLLCLPVGIVAFICDWGDLAVFWWNFGAMIPLAKILGDATEELAANLKNDMIAGILNATFGNAVELIIMVQTLHSGLYDVVKATLLGSVLSNSLLVLGMSFLCGGFFTFQKGNAANMSIAQQSSLQQYERVAQDSRPQPGDGSTALDQSRAHSLISVPYNPQTEKVQSFSVLGALVSTSMLLSSCTSFCLITIFSSVLEDNAVDKEAAEEVTLRVSRLSAVVIILAYVAFIIFQLVTHRQTMSDLEEQDDDDGEGGEDEGHLPFVKAVLLLLVATLLTAFSSELLVEAIAGVTERAHLNQHFIGMIILPIVGNACEHAAAVRFAMHDKLGLSVSIAIGSSTQISLFVVPFAVLMGWAMNRPLDLNFGFFNSSMITLSVIVVLSMVVDGHSNWLQGYLLCSIYAIIGVLYYYLPDDGGGF
mmetsp:Transcript_42349/g.99423  ORF Transcript_42349/g.99423 Transcript_42349/m.99423 type:complete len:490 (-) Transcript_42349:47-1516(-)